MKRAAMTAVILILAGSVGPLTAQEEYRLSGDRAAVYNLAGEVSVVEGRGPDILVRVVRGGDDAARLSVEVGEVSGVEALRVVYPDESIVYPAQGRGGSTNLFVRRDGTFGGGGEGAGERVSIRGSGRGMEAWADLVIEVPPGKDFSVYLAVGELEANRIDGSIRLDTGSGSVRATDMSGSLVVDTGSGSVTVQGLRGSLGVDTGSGRVEVNDVQGGSVGIDTGSGLVVGRGIRGDEVEVDTGSGSVELEGLTASDIVVDTGSGSVTLVLLSDVDQLDVDTGSGSVTVHAPASLGAEVELDTGSGGIDVDFDLVVHSVRRDRMTGRIGDGVGTIRIDTGSGSIRLIRN